MIKNSTLFALIALFSLLVKPTNTHAVNYNLTGEWNWTDSTINQDFHGTAQINHDGETLTLTWTWDANSPPLWTGSGSTSGTTFSLDGVYGDGGGFTAHWDGTILENGNKLEGTWLQSDGQNGTFVATRIGPAPSPFPDPSPTPTPFLDLPWDYEGKGLSFTEAALAINSYFDHEYPLLSSVISEPTNRQNQITTFQSENSTSKKYSSHDGYDYGKDAKVFIGDPVLASATGCASYFKDGATGNAIKIDHGNGYQTRYYHLSDNDLITNASTCTDVTKGQQIGRVGATGNVIPPGDLGAHIHFMVVQDKNNDGNFDDNIPDGVTDPFGWQSTEPDPWTNFNFFYSEENRTGNESFYLWTKPIANLLNQLTTNGGFFELERYKLEFPQNATNQNLTLEMQAAPVAKPSNILESIGSTITITAKDALGNIADTFQNFFTITIQFDGFDLSGYNADTISIYSSEDGINWVKEETNVNLSEKTASAQVNHLSQFALMAERLDIVAPTTIAILTGAEGQSVWYRSDVQISLNAGDNSGGLGVDYTMYKVDEGDWQEYLLPFTLNQEGSHTIDFYSVDKDENIERIKSTSFTIDKQIPEAKIYIDQIKKDLVVEGVDENETNITRTTANSYQTTYIISDLAGNTMTMDARDFNRVKFDKFKIYALTYNQNPTSIPSKNLYRVIYQGKNSQLSVRQQYFELGGTIKIKIVYDKKRNKSSIYTLQGKKLKLAEVRDGLTLLQLVTNQGNLEYSY